MKTGIRKQAALMTPDCACGRTQQSVKRWLGYAFVAVTFINVLGINNRAEAADATPNVPLHDYGTVQGLYELCTVDDRAHFNVMACFGYISGIRDMMMVIGTLDAPVKIYFGLCSKDEVASGATVQAFKNWAEKHPEMWSKPRGAGVGIALREAWPCT